MILFYCSIFAVLIGYIFLWIAMNKNIGIVDKAIRILIAFVIVGFYVANIVNGVFAIVLLVLAVVLLLTALIRFCPLYWLFGINTWNKKKLIV